MICQQTSAKASRVSTTVSYKARCPHEVDKYQTNRRLLWLSIDCAAVLLEHRNQQFHSVSWCSKPNKNISCSCQRWQILAYRCIHYSGQTEICDFHIPVLVNKQIRRFKISMYDRRAILMQIKHSSRSLAARNQQTINHAPTHKVEGHTEREVARERERERARARWRERGRFERERERGGVERAGTFLPERKNLISARN